MAGGTHAASPEKFLQMGKSVVLSAEAVAGGWTGDPVITLGTIEHVEKDGCGGVSAMLKGYPCIRMGRGPGVFRATPCAYL